jgi:antigen flippase
VVAVAGAVVSILCFVILREDGIVPALVIGAFVQMLAAAFWSRGLPLPEPDSTTRWSGDVARSLLTLGGVSVLVGLQASFVGLVVRRLILGARDLEAVGIFQAAQGLSSLYATYILGAMSADFLPRLTSAMHDREAGNRMLNEQTTIALLLGLPGVLATIVFAPLAVPLFYSTEFAEAVPVLQFMALAVFGRLLAWPLGMALMAIDARTYWVVGEIVCSLVQVGTAWILLPSWGLMGAAFSQIAVSAVCCALYYAWVRRLTGLRWSASVWSSAGAGLLFCSLALGLTFITPGWPGLAAGCLLMPAVMVFSLRRLAFSAGVTRVGIANRLLGLRAAVLRRFAGQTGMDR